LARGDHTLAQNNKKSCWKLAHVKAGFGGPVYPAGAQINMPDQPPSDPQFWRNQAGQARAKADQTINDQTRRLLLRIAESYERVAELVERRAGAGESK
jgi:hypothetical protein